ncbi:MAG: type II toxin-antitoxin system PemK/MazF family toxin [Chloroflexota bacterium]
MISKPKHPLQQGNIYWIHPKPDENSQLGTYSHPYVVVQDDIFNQSRIHTVVVCALTTNINLANEPGNVLLNEGEGGLEKRSVVVVSKISSIEKERLGGFIGRLAPERVQKILSGLRFQQKTYFQG